MGATDPTDADENTIRKLYGISIDKNSVHGSDSLKMQKKLSFFLRTNPKIFNYSLRIKQVFKFLGLSLTSFSLKSKK